MVVKYNGIEVVLDDNMLGDNEYIKKTVGDMDLSLEHNVGIFRKIFLEV